MAIKFSCPHCRKTLNVRDYLAGKKARCPACKKPLTIPASSSARLPAPADVEALAAAALADELKPPEPAVEQTTIEFKCYYCDESVRISADLAGKQTPCPECRRIIKVPLLEKKQPKDWRKMDTRLPAGARRDAGPVPEGAWDTASVGVSRQALVEAQAIPRTRRRLTAGQWIKRGTATAAGVLVLGGVAWLVTHYLGVNRQNQALAKALQSLEGTGDKIKPEGAAEIHRGAGEFSVRTSSRGSAEAARSHFQQARAAILQPAAIDPLEREAFLIELALAQVDLGGEKPEIENETRISWEEAQKEIRQTLQNLLSPEGRGEAVRRVTRKLLAKNQGMRAGAMASLFPEQVSELLAVAGLELLRAKQEQLAETLADQALQNIALPVPPQGIEPKPSAVSGAPSLIALWLALGKPDKAAAVAPPAEAGKGQDFNILIGNIEALAFQGKWEQARERLRGVTAPEERLPALLALTAAAEDNGQAAAVRPELEAALSLVETEGKDRPIAPWQLVRLARAAVNAGLEERTVAVARLVPDLATGGRMQLEILRRRLAASKERADDSWTQLVDANTPAHPQALEMLARHNSRQGAGTAMQRTIEGWDEKHQPFGYLGVALGLQDRNQ
jgi:hypothetical protein